MRDDTILNRLADSDSPDEAARSFMFHGTGEAFDDAVLKPSPSDGLFWMAREPKIAQSYIPSSGLKSFVRLWTSDLKERVRPDQHDPLFRAVCQMSFAPLDVEWDHTGRATSWSMPRGYPTNADAVRWLQDTLGYQPKTTSNTIEFTLKCTMQSGDITLLPASSMTPGRLFVLDGWQNLRFYDMTRGDDGDLQEPDHLRFAEFRKIESEGYDGVIINDFAQTEYWGNFGHRSWGVFSHALPKIHYAVVPCVRFEYSEASGDMTVISTPEFTEAWEDARASHSFCPR